MKLLSATAVLVFSILNSSPVSAEWKCPQGQPMTCQGQVRHILETNADQIASYHRREASGPSDLNTCRDEVQRLQHEAETATRAASTLDGALEELRRSREVSFKAAKMVSRQLEILDALKSKFQNYFKDVVMALDAAIASDDLQNVRVLRDSLFGEWQQASDPNRREVLAMVIAMVDEIVNVPNSGAKDELLLDRLSQAIRPGSAAKLSQLTKSAIESGILSGADLESLSLSDTISVAINQARATYQELYNRHQETLTRITSKEELLSTQQNQGNHYRSLARDKSNQCNALSRELTVGFADEINGLQSEINRLNQYNRDDGCRKEFCTLERNDNTGWR